MTGIAHIKENVTGENCYHKDFYQGIKIASCETCRAMINMAESSCVKDGAQTRPFRSYPSGHFRLTAIILNKSINFTKFLEGV